MKDPLQNNLSAYEILNLKENAKKEEIRPAFLKALKGKYKSKAVGAKTKLDNEKSRLKEDFFLYDLGFLESVGLKDDLESKLTIHRIDVASDWQKKQSASFPEVTPITHSLLILWYWTAINSVETVFEKLESDSVSLTQVDKNKIENAWNKAIAHFAATLNTDSYLSKWIQRKSYIGTEIANNLKSELRENIQLSFDDRLQNYADNPASEKGDLTILFQKLLNNLNLEISTASKIKLMRISIDTKTNGIQKIPALGKMFLEEYAYLDQVRDIISDVNTGNNNEKINNLLIALSPYSNIQSLINKKLFNDAIAEIEKLPQSEKTKSELKKLKHDCIVGIGRFSISSGNLMEFLEYKKKYLNTRTVATKKVVLTLADDIFKLVANVKTSKKEGIFELLEWANTYVPDHKNIKLKLATLYLERGIQTYNKGYGAYQKDPSEKNLLLLKSGLKDVEKAKKLNPTEQRINKNYDAMKKVIDAINYVDPKKQNALKKNDEGVKIINGCQNDYVKYMQSKNTIKQFTEIKLKPGQDYTAEAGEILKNALDTINSKLDGLRSDAERALDCFETALKYCPGNVTFQKNKDYALKMLSELQTLNEIIEGGPTKTPTKGVYRKKPGYSRTRPKLNYSRTKTTKNKRKSLGKFLLGLLKLTVFLFAVIGTLVAAEIYTLIGELAIKPFYVSSLKVLFAMTQALLLYKLILKYGILELVFIVGIIFIIDSGIGVVWIVIYCLIFVISFIHKVALNSQLKNGGIRRK